MPVLLRRIVLLQLLTLAFSFTSTAIGQQRMGIAAGALEVAANDVAQVATYCLDFSRDSPKPSDAYNHVLTGNESATVHFDNGTAMPLQQALQQHLVQMQGVDHISFADFLKSVDDPAFQQRHPMSAQEKKNLADLRNLWNSASPAEKKELDQAFAEATPGFSDHTHLKIKNNTNQHLKVTFDETTVISPRDESLQGAAYTHIGHAEGNQGQVIKQQEIWMYGDAQQQSALAYLGYYKGDVDGLTGAGTKAAIAKFQAADGLPVTRQFDASTTAALHNQVNTKRLAEFNSQKQGFAVVTITNTPGNASGRYAVNFGPGQAAFATSSPVELAQKLNSVASSSASKSLYIDFDSFTDDRAKALTSNLKRQQQAIDPTVELHGVTRSEVDPELQGILFDGASRVEASAIRVERITEGPQKGFFRAIVDLVIHFGSSVRRISVNIISSTQSFATELAQLIGLKAQESIPLSASGSSRLSVAQIVASAEKDFRLRHPGLSDDAYSKQVQSQFGTLEISDLLVPPTPVG